MAELILHQYATSPFSEKVRLLLGAKGLAWQAVEIPPILPKPDVIALTGGYRRTPVLQIGADVYCDTALICDVIDALAPSPAPLYPPAQAGAARLLASWFDTVLFGAVASYLFQTGGAQEILGRMTPEQIQAFRADRKAMRGDGNALGVPLGEAAALLRDTLARLEVQMAGGVPHVAGAALSLADFSLYHNLWFLKRAPVQTAWLEGYPAIQSWYARMQAFGHGEVRVIDSATALAAAQAAVPQPLTAQASADSGFAVGDGVCVTPTDYARDPVSGTLVSLDDRMVTLRRQDPRAGALNVHFPRLGFHVQRAA
ncbi:glutathione S-transferase [Cupriavidus sp. USMAA2-4]|nr:glutathione S-transferase family protein [Cupriavidus sp. USMAHM13]AOY90630.1 glutathione S-transferase [Cupriavidus sp. USMAA2-4]AOY99745.1 glutathione S-transferase [Cupriavidus sp. USMAHM13]